MKFIHRLAYYLFGLSIGLIFLAFFLSGKEVRCDYSPNARVKKNIRTKTQQIPEPVLQSMREQQLDTSHIGFLLQKGTVDFSESITDLDSCNVYIIRGETTNRALKLTVENCSKTVNIKGLQVED